MAVTVIVGTYSGGIDNTRDVYSNADEVRVDDGHLFVDDDSLGNVGVYAPGKWISAHVDESRVQQSN